MQQALFDHALPDRQQNPAKFAAISAKRPEIPLDFISPELYHKPFRLGVCKNKKGEELPCLKGGPRIQRRRADGSQLRTALFTVTSKMSCLSFSLPAGPTPLGGTCPASDPRNIDKQVLGRDKTSKGFICGECYAAKNRYLYGSIQASQTFRKLWVLRCLSQPDGEHYLAEQLLNAINVATMVTMPQDLASVDVDPQFFRIHDSGDFFDVSAPGVDQFAYYRAWVYVALQLPSVRFWAPTRMWVFPEWMAAFQTIEGGVPANLSLRPSALWFDAPPPMLPGLAPGSGSAKGGMRNVWNCPAYTSQGRSCASAGCRACWEQQAPVSYEKH